MKGAQRLERLVRVRRAERDRARLDCELRAREAERVARASEAGERELANQRDRFARSTRTGGARAWWMSAVAGLRALGVSAETGRQAAAGAEAAHAEARERLLEARRRLRGAERLVERAERERRRAAARAEQKRLDDVKPRAAARDILRTGVLLVAAGAALGAPPAAAEETSQPTPGVAILLGEIRMRQAELDTREGELTDRERHVEELEAAVDARIAELDTITTAVEERIANWEKAHADKQLSRLAKIYGSMEPATAARLLEELELDLATRIIAKMKHKQSAELLPLISQPRALAMSRSVAHPLGNPALPAEESP